ncbi:MAG: RNA polymerase factor sigma-54 [Planctomycetes bacterium]|nr:RNA polymerase factor sigma-54 [Planctomycetota bacterium]MCC7397416.1 RNA polymerase factor sigma-54 [Planctomycetota bacterium]
MRLGLTQSLRAEQRLVQSPQMIQAMQVLQQPLLELKDQIEQELQENVFLERKDEAERPEGQEPPTPAAAPEQPADNFEDRLQRDLAAEIDQLEARTDSPWRSRQGTGSADEEDRKFEALNNTPGRATSLPDYLMTQVRTQESDPGLIRVIEHIVFSLDEDGRLAETKEGIAQQLLAPLPLVQEAIEVVRDLDPVGVGAVDLRDCLLMQLDHMAFVKPLTRLLVERHLDDLAMNKLPKIAKETGANIEDIKESWEFLRLHCNPHPGSEFEALPSAGVVPDVVIEDVDGRFEVKSKRGTLPELTISPVYRNLLQEAKHDPKVYEYLRRKIDAAKWFIEAVHQRQNTIERVATEIVRRQEGFLRHGVQHLIPMKMQDIADAVHVHISTISRATSGKFIQTPQGIFDMKRFFSSGTMSDAGDMVSQQAIKDTLKQIVDNEDKDNPLSDDQLVEELGKRGVHIARRTVTKYRKALRIESSSRRKRF